MSYSQPVVPRAVYRYDPVGAPLVHVLERDRQRRELRAAAEFAYGHDHHALFDVDWILIVGREAVQVVEDAAFEGLVAAFGPHDAGVEGFGTGRKVSELWGEMKGIRTMLCGPRLEWRESESRGEKRSR